MNNEEKAEILKSTEKLWNERNRLKDLEKENEQLKCDLYNTNANLQRITIEYEKENAELEIKFNDSNELCNKQAMRIAELEAQIEKMKNFYNCTKYHYCFCKTKNCKDCKDWKMND